MYDDKIQNTLSLALILISVIYIIVIYILFVPNFNFSSSGLGKANLNAYGTGIFFTILYIITIIKIRFMLLQENLDYSYKILTIPLQRTGISFAIIAISCGYNMMIAGFFAGFILLAELAIAFIYVLFGFTHEVVEYFKKPK